MQEVPDSDQKHAFGVRYPDYVEASDGLSTPIQITLGSTDLFTGTVHSSGGTDVSANEDAGTAVSTPTSRIDAG
jgi:hypothetical protein